jgi:uncharacterized membrane protein
MSINLTNLLDFNLWIAVIEFVGALFIVGYVIAAIVSLFRVRSISYARLLVADGVITGLSFKLAGTLLKSIIVHTWQQILLFAFIFVLRTILKRAFTWERVKIQATFAKQQANQQGLPNSETLAQ